MGEREIARGMIELSCGGLTDTRPRMAPTKIETEALPLPRIGADVLTATGHMLMIKRRKKRTSAAASGRRRSPSPRSRQTGGSESENRAISPLGTSVVVVMGVSGCGKSTIASMLAHRLNWIYEDGDWFHPQSNVKKMHAGEQLTHEDRWPWLHGIAAWIDATGAPAIVAPSLARHSNAAIAISWSVSAPTSVSSI